MNGLLLSYHVDGSASKPGLAVYSGGSLRLSDLLFSECVVSFISFGMGPHLYSAGDITHPGKIPFPRFQQDQGQFYRGIRRVLYDDQHQPVISGVLCRGGYDHRRLQHDAYAGNRPIGTAFAGLRSPPALCRTQYGDCGSSNSECYLRLFDRLTGYCLLRFDHEQVFRSTS